MGETTVGRPRALPPLRGVFWGLLLVVVDIRVDDIDLVPDPIGWVVALVALAGLARRHGGFVLAATGCVLGLLASVPDWTQPDQAWVQWVVAVAETAVVLGTCTALVDLLPARRRAANLIRWWDLGLFLAAVPLQAIASSGGPLLIPAVLAAVAVLTVFVCFLVLLLRASAGPPEFGPDVA